MAISGGTGERVVSLLRKLDGNASELRQETAALQAERAQWVPSEVPKNVNAISSAAVPQRCADKLEEAAAHERRTAQFARRTRTGERDAQRYREQRQEIERATQTALQAALQRRLEAEQRVAAVSKERQQAEADHRVLLAAEETDHEVEMKALEAALEAVRQAEIRETAQSRRNVAATKEQCARDVTQAHQDFETERINYERALDEFDANADAAVKAAQQRCQDAEAFAQDKWSQFEEQSKAAHADAEDRVALYNRNRDGTVIDVNARLAEIETSLNQELKAISAREQSALSNRTPEQRLQATTVSVMEDICRRRNECDSSIADSLDRIAKMTSEAEQGAAKTSARVQAAEDNADRNIEAIRAGLEKFAQGDHQGKIIELQASLNNAIAGAQNEFLLRLQRFREEADRQSREASEALAAADQRVEELRQQANARMETQMLGMSEDISSIRDEREQLRLDTTSKVQKTQDQMVQYIGSQFEDMLDSLSKTGPPEVPIRLDFTALALEAGKASSSNVVA
mmetsp:Transcript_99538/g.172785  ORF Transcript_99538/g.172785 Transcript_99538/m.172785 type:complete len:517 (+) Transcript_99538:97-1647(+)